MTHKTISAILLILITVSLFGASQPKLKILYMQMHHCPWCHKMNKEVFENPKITQKLSKMYTIESRFRGDTDLPPFIQPRFYPTTYVLSTDGKKLVDELPGYMEPDRFLDYLTELYELETKKD